MYSPHTNEDERSLLMSPNCSQAFCSPSYMSASQSTVLTPSDGAVQLNRMYLEAKTNMLKIIELGLQLKLDIQKIKDKFLKLIGDLEQYEQRHRSPVPLPHYTPEVTKRPGNKMSAARMRVRTFYELRKARIRARRAAFERNEPETETAGAGEDGCRSRNLASKLADDRRPEPRRLCGNPGASSTPLNKYKDRPLSTMTWSVRKFLTPIKEERSDRQSSISGVTGNSLLRRHSSPSDIPSPDTPDTLHRRTTADQTDTSQYVTMSALRNEYVNQSELQTLSGCTADLTPTTHRRRPRVADHKSADAGRRPGDRRQRCRSLGDMSSGVPPAPAQRTTASGSAGRRHGASPVPSAPSDVISEIYTSALKDISVIGKTSEADVNDQASISKSTVSDELNSSSSYPLHSTLKYPLHSTLSVDDSLLDRDASWSSPSETRTTVSEPSHVVGSRKKNSPSQSSHHAVDDSCMNYRSYNADTSHDASSTTRQQAFSPSSYRTPSRKPQAELCKEHGIHPTFGGSCIFQNGDSVTLNSSDEELDQDENGNTSKVTGGTIRETDCDSSYLSECLDDHQSSIDVDQYEATYDSRMACIRILKRQTGQVKLTDIREPVGLSESDLYCDIMKKHFSLEAMRSSLPDLSGLSTRPTSSAAEDESSDLTLQASSMLKGHTLRGSDEPSSLNDTLVANERRPVSPSANEESPESNPAMPVPVNSPNITDSGGSSGRQNTDNYDYVDVPPPPPPQAKAASDRASLPSSQTTHSSQSCRSRKAHSLRSHHSHHSSKSYQPHQQSGHVHQKHRRRYASTPAQLSDVRSSRTARSRASHGTKTKPSSVFPRPSVMCCHSAHHQSYDLDSACFAQPNRQQSTHFTIRDNMGRQRTIVQHSPVSRHLPKERKKALVKKLKHFSNSFYEGTSTGNLQIQTLGHF